MFNIDKMFKELFISIEESVQVCELVWDDNEQPVDVIIHDVNPAYEKHSGLKKEDVVGKSINVILPNLDQVWLDRLADVVSEEKPIKFQKYNKNTNRWFDVQIKPLSESYFVNIFIDITEFKQIEENEARLKIFMDNSPALVFIKDEKGKYEYLNKTYENQFVQSNDWHGKTDYDFWSKKSADLFRKNDTEVLDSQEINQFIEDSTDKKGNRYCWLNYKFPIIDSRGKKFLGGIGLDATDYVKAKEELKKPKIIMSI